MIGKIKWFNDKKGYGFITSKDIDYFVLYTSLGKEFEGTNGYRTVNDGTAVEFEAQDHPKGSMAVNVSLYRGDDMGNI